MWAYVYIYIDIHSYLEIVVGVYTYSYLEIVVSVEFHAVLVPRDPWPGSSPRHAQEDDLPSQDVLQLVVRGGGDARPLMVGRILI